MSDNETPESNGGYVFISHAHKDIHEIRRIRNKLEEEGLDPICFYLRCLSDHDEIIDLIKREIDAREWFLLVDSENARKSNWVKTEVDYIKSKNPDKLVKISLDEEEKINLTLSRLANSMRVFLSYSVKDKDIAGRLYDACVKRDFKVFDYSNIKAGTNYAEVITGEIVETSKRGCFVSILSSNSIDSDYCAKELVFAVQHKAKVLPVLIDDVELPSAKRFLLAGIQVLHLSTPITDDQIDMVVNEIERRMTERLHGNE